MKNTKEPDFSWGNILVIAAVFGLCVFAGFRLKIIRSGHQQSITHSQIKPQGFVR